jgi:hypothetical protein
LAFGLQEGDKNVTTQTTDETHGGHVYRHRPFTCVRSMGYLEGEMMDTSTHFHPFSKPVQQHWSQFPGGETIGTKGYEHQHAVLGHTATAVTKRFYPSVKPTLGASLPSISGKHAGWAIIGAIIGNTILSRQLEKSDLWTNLTKGMVATGFGITIAGSLATAKGITSDDIRMLAVGGALLGLGIFYLLPAGERRG